MGTIPKEVIVDATWPEEEWMVKQRGRFQLYCVTLTGCKKGKRCADRRCDQRELGYYVLDCAEHAHMNDTNPFPNKIKQYRWSLCFNPFQGC